MLSKFDPQNRTLGVILTISDARTNFRLSDSVCTLRLVSSLSLSRSYPHYEVHIPPQTEDHIRHIGVHMERNVDNFTLSRLYSTSGSTSKRLLETSLLLCLSDPTSLTQLQWSCVQRRRLKLALLTIRELQSHAEKFPLTDLTVDFDLSILSVLLTCFLCLLGQINLHDTRANPHKLFLIVASTHMMKL